MFVVQKPISSPTEFNSLQRREGFRASRNSSLNRSGRLDSAGRGAATRQEIGADPVRGGNILTPPAAQAPAPPSPAASNEHSGLTKLRSTMQALGMNSAGLQISYDEEVVGYPGGSYVNRLITVSNGGKTERFSADLTDRNPLVTAYEMQRYFSINQQA